MDNSTIRNSKQSSFLVPIDPPNPPLPGTQPQQDNMRVGQNNHQPSQAGSGNGHRKVAAPRSPSGPQVRHPEANKLLDEYFPSRFLKSDQFDIWGLKELIATIARAQEEEVYSPLSKSRSKKLVLYLRPKSGNVFPNGYLVSAKSDLDALISSTGALTLGDLPGKRIRVVTSKFRGTPVLRIDPSPA